jgi:hypothetical protein
MKYDSPLPYFIFSFSVFTIQLASMIFYTKPFPPLPHLLIPSWSLKQMNQILPKLCAICYVYLYEIFFFHFRWLRLLILVLPEWKLRLELWQQKLGPTDGWLLRCTFAPFSLKEFHAYQYPSQYQCANYLNFNLRVTSMAILVSSIVVIWLFSIFLIRHQFSVIERESTCLPLLINHAPPPNDYHGNLNASLVFLAVTIMHLLIGSSRHFLTTVILHWRSLNTSRMTTRLMYSVLGSCYGSC